MLVDSENIKSNREEIMDKIIEVYDFDKLTYPMMEAIKVGDVKLARELKTKIINKYKEEIQRICEEVITSK